MPRRTRMVVKARAVVAAVLAAAVAAVGGGAALARPVAADPSVSAGEGGDGVEIRDRRAGEAPSPASRPTGSRAAPGPPAGAAPVTVVLRPELRWDAAAGRVCLRIHRGPGEAWLASPAALETLVWLTRTYPRCPATPSQRPVPTSSSPFGETSWRELVSLPAPTLRFAPGAAVTGLPGCLEIGGPAAVTKDVPTPFGSVVRLHVTSTYDVDWGDGTAGVTGTSERGGPCPDGRLRHRYRWRGTVTVTVVQRWRATWATADGGGGRLPEELRTVGRLVLPVREVQAVRTGS